MTMLMWELWDQILSVNVVVGPILWLDVLVSSVKVNALVDSGFQSTFISWQLFHRIVKKLFVK